MREAIKNFQARIDKGKAIGPKFILFVRVNSGFLALFFIALPYGLLLWLTQSSLQSLWISFHGCRRGLCCLYAGHSSIEVQDISVRSAKAI